MCRKMWGSAEKRVEVWRKVRRGGEKCGKVCWGVEGSENRCGEACGGKVRIKKWREGLECGEK